MASIEQAPPSGAIDVSVEQAVVSPLNQLLARVYTLDWTLIFYVTMFAAAVLTRFIGIGDRVMSHDESLHSNYSFQLWKQGTFQHTPLMHGPLIFHMTALSFFLFGDSDATARFYPAILGILVVMMPKLLFEKWLGKRGAMVATVLLLISPMVLFHSRYIREDIPSIFFTLLMVYSLFRYIDNERPRQFRWLLLLAGATVLSLASKEVGFMYIAIFGSFLTLFWLMQVLRGVRTRETAPIVGRILGGVLGVIVLGGAALIVGGTLGDKLNISRPLVEAAVLIVFALAAFAFLKPIVRLMGNVGERADSTLQTVLNGVVLGAVASLIMTVIVNIAIPKVAFDPTDPNSGVMLSHLILWTALTVIVLLAIVFGTALIGFWRIRRLPWLEIVAIVGIALVVCAGLLYEEERSKQVPDTSASHAAAVEPGNPTAAASSQYQDGYIAGAWVIGIAAILGILGLRAMTPFFQEMKRYPTFDALIVLGTLVLPWLAAFPMFLAGYQLDSYPAADRVVQAGILTEIPFVAVAIVAGLCWNPGVWIACAATFYSLFAFFYTTIFTNPQGIVSGVIGSLGYWLAQQGVRRGSQPQYYYMLVELPVYEFLPVIGAMLAGIAGLTIYWRGRAEKYVAAFTRQLAEQQAPLEAPTDSMLDNAVSDVVVTVITADISTNTAAAEPMPQSSDWQATQLNSPTMESIPIEGAEAVPVVVETIGPPLPPLPGWLERLDMAPFMAFVAWWGVLILYAFTLSGEKMPWLTTHLTIPFIFATGWLLGTVLEHVHWPAFFRQGWALIVLTPILVIAFANVIGPFIVGQAPFAGLERDQLLQTGVWLAALMITALTLYGIIWVLARIGIQQTARTMLIGAFVLLGVLTARTAWRFAYIDYDYATEFGVYAHGAPAYKTVMNQLDQLSRQTTDGLSLKVGYDNDVSWPGTWYFRNYTKAVFLGDPSGATDLDTYAALLVSQAHSTAVEAQLNDQFYKYNFIRLWWPMQDYFNLTPQRIDNVFAADDATTKGSALRRGLWDIWWNRDYNAYGQATGENFDISQWPVADRMVFYVRKDIAAQVWTMGVGNVSPVAAPTNPFAKLRCTTCAADAVFAGNGSNPGQLNHPRGMAFGPDGNLYVADSLNGRISIFDRTGKLVNTFGTIGAGSDKGTAAPGQFQEPWDVAVGADGWVYVSDTWNSRVQVFDAQHQFVTMWGHLEQIAGNQAGSNDGFWGPRAIAVDDQNRVYVADTGNKRIRVYDRTGKLLTTIGSAGAAPGQLNEPVGLAFDAKTQHLFVADSWNKRIEVFDVNAGSFVSSWPVPAWTGSSNDTGTRPYLALDPTGTRLYAAEPDLGQILVWDVSSLNAQGGEQPLIQFGLKGTTLDNLHFNILGGLATDAQGNLYAADSENGRVLRFSPNNLPGVAIPPPVNPPVPVQQQPATQNTF
ncbi:MAG: flippase activity-associated protein Agl23 [Aggregatilineales bacterium]